MIQKGDWPLMRGRGREEWRREGGEVARQGESSDARQIRRVRPPAVFSKRPPNKTHIGDSPTRPLARTHARCTAQPTQPVPEVGGAASTQGCIERLRGKVHSRHYFLLALHVERTPQRVYERRLCISYISSSSFGETRFTDRTSSNKSHCGVTSQGGQRSVAASEGG